MRASVEDEERIPARDHLGKKYVSMSAMARAYGISDHLLITRLGRGWSLKRALTTPIRPYVRVR